MSRRRQGPGLADRDPAIPWGHSDAIMATRLSHRRVAEDAAVTQASVAVPPVGGIGSGKKFLNAVVLGGLWLGNPPCPLFSKGDYLAFGFGGPHSSPKRPPLEKGG